MALRSAAAGVDTWAPAWRLAVDSALARQLAERATLPSAKGGMLVPDRVGGHRVMFWPASGLLKAEGHPVEHGLAPVPALPAALERLTAAMHDAGVPPPEGERRFRRHREASGFAGVRRLDLTVDLRADSTDEGRQVLSAVEAAARSSAFHAPTYGRPGKPGATVYLAGDSGMLGRWYDKGAESGSAPAFRLIRPEAQWRFRDHDAPALCELADVEWMRARFARRWGPGMRGRIVVADMTTLGRKLAEEVEAGRLTPAQARRIAGYLVMQPHGLTGVPLRTRERLRAEASGFGFHLVDGVLEPLDVDLGAVLQEAERADLWESGAIGAVELPDDQEAEVRGRLAERAEARAARELPDVGAGPDRRWRDELGRRTRGPRSVRPSRDGEPPAA